jgi:hypothetical protein
MTGKKQLPDIWGAIGIVGALLMMEWLISVAFYDAGVMFESGNPRSFVIVVLANGIVFSVLMHVYGLGYRELFHPSANTAMGTVIALSVPILLVISGSFW